MARVTADSRAGGFALIGVLWMLALLFAVAAGTAASLRDELELVRNLVSSAQARHASQAGVQLALYEATRFHAQGDWQPDGGVHEARLGEALLRFTVADEAGRIDLNEAPPALLEGLLLSAGVPAAEAARLSDAILERRAAGKAHDEKSLAFVSVEELFLVPGMTAELQRRLAPALTVHSRQPRVIAECAPREVLLAIPGARAAEIDLYLRLRQRSRDAGLAPPAPPEALREHLSRNGSGTLRIHAQARLPGGATAHTHATVDLRKPGIDAPWRFVEWRHEGPELFADFAAAAPR